MSGKPVLSPSPSTGIDRSKETVVDSESNKLPFAHIFMQMAEIVSQRAGDSKTHVGCILVNKFNQIVGMGYNAESKGTPAEQANLRDMDGLMVHAEMNAVTHATTNLMREELYVFVTRQPCKQCMKVLGQYNIKAIFYLNFGKYQSYTIPINKRFPVINYRSLFQYDKVLDGSLNDKSNTSSTAAATASTASDNDLHDKSNTSSTAAATASTASDNDLHDKSNTSSTAAATASHDSEYDGKLDVVDSKDNVTYKILRPCFETCKKECQLCNGYETEPIVELSREAYLAIVDQFKVKKKYTNKRHRDIESDY